MMRAFYEKYFDARANPKYENERKQFASYFRDVSGKQALGADAGQAALR